MNKLIKQVLVSINPSGEKVIIWRLNANIVVSEEPRITVQFSRGLDTWEDLNSSEITTEYYYIDTVKRNYSTKNDGYYRVIAKEGPKVHISDPVGINGILNWNEYRIARDFIKKHNIYHKKAFYGNEGWLLKRKQWGTECSTCTDFVTGNVVNTECSACYGTRFIGGYYTGVEVYMEFLPSEKKKEEVKMPIATEDNRVQGAKCVAFPILETMDVFVEKHTNKRYIIREITSIAEMRGLPLLYQVLLSEAPKSHVIYNVPCGLV